jgi:2'-5' RNA ligase
MAQIRLFIAIELTNDVLSALNQVQHSLQREPALARLRWVQPEGIHITLKFLGETPAERQPAIEAAIVRAVAGIAPFELHLGKPSRFGSRQSPRVVWIDVNGDTESLARLQTQVEREITPLGYPSENHSFSPHLTLARVPPERARDVGGPLEDAIARTTVPTAAMQATEVSLMKSDLQRGGAVYTQLFAARLAG